MSEVVPLKCAFISSCFLVILLIHSLTETYVPKCTADVWVLWYWAILMLMWILCNFLCCLLLSSLHPERLLPLHIHSLYSFTIPQFFLLFLH